MSDSTSCFLALGNELALSCINEKVNLPFLLSFIHRQYALGHLSDRQQHLSSTDRKFIQMKTAVRHLLSAYVLL